MSPPPRKSRPSDGTRGSTSVIGVILLVAIAVIVASVVGITVLQMGQKVSKSPPQAMFSVERQEDTFGSATCGVVFVEHESGDRINAENLRVTVNGEQAWDAVGMGDGAGGTVRPTSNVDTLTAGTRLRIVYWKNDYDGFPIEKDDLYTEQQGLGGGNQRHVVTTDGVSDAALENDMVQKGDEIRIIYNFPNSGQTVTLATLTVSTGQLNEYRCY